MEGSKWEQGSLHFYRCFWRCSSACLSIFWSLETSSGLQQSLLPNTGSIFLPFRWRQENQKFKLNFGYHFFFKNHNTWKSPLCTRQRDQIKAANGMCRLFADCCRANLITSLLKLHHYFPWREDHRLKYCEGGRSGHNPTITVTANSAVMGRGSVLVPIH